MNVEAVLYYVKTNENQRRIKNKDGKEVATK